MHISKYTISTFCRESCKKHAENIKNIFEQTQGQHKCLRELLQESLCDSDECTLFKCEARLGKVVWRYQDGNRLQDLLKSPKGSEFYTRYMYRYMYIYFTCTCNSGSKTLECIMHFIVFIQSKIVDYPNIC